MFKSTILSVFLGRLDHIGNHGLAVWLWLYDLACWVFLQEKGCWLCSWICKKVNLWFVLHKLSSHFTIGCNTVLFWHIFYQWFQILLEGWSSQGNSRWGTWFYVCDTSNVRNGKGVVFDLIFRRFAWNIDIINIACYKFCCLIFEMLSLSISGPCCKSFWSIHNHFGGWPQTISSWRHPEQGSTKWGTVLGSCLWD